MNPYDDLIITYIKIPSEYSSDCELASKKFLELSEQEEADFFEYFLLKDNPKIKEKLKTRKLFTLEEIKEITNFTITNKDELLFYSGYGRLERIGQNAKLDDYTIDKIANSSCLIAISTPKNIKDQIDARKKTKEQKKKLTEEQKLARKLKKAEKILREAGKL